MRALISIPILIVIFLLCCTRAPAGDIIEELKEAAKIIDNSARLQKYDALLEKYKLREKSKTDIGSKGTEAKWLVSVDTDPVDDSKRIIFSLLADQGKSSFGKPIGLIIRYANNRTELYICWNDYLGSEAYITMRIGDEKAERSRWGMSTDSQGAFYPGNVVKLINKIIQVNQLVFQCIPYNENPVTAIFDVSGLKEAADPYIADLRWW